MPQAKIDGAERLFELAKQVEWPEPLSAWKGSPVHVNGSSNAVRVRIAKQQIYFGTLPSVFHAARLADLVVVYFQAYNGGGKVPAEKINFSVEQAELDLTKSDLKDLMVRWELLLSREGVISLAGNPEVKVVTLEACGATPASNEELAKLIADLQERVSRLEELTRPIDITPRTDYVIPGPPEPYNPPPRVVPQDRPAFTSLAGKSKGPTVPSLFKPKP